MKYETPGTGKTAFNCPHCGALAKQFWYSLYAESLGQENPLPQIVNALDEFDFSHLQDDLRAIMEKFFDKLSKGSPFLEKSSSTRYNSPSLCNVFLSECFNCSVISIWIYDKLVYPAQGDAPPPNPDLPENILVDYREASSILDKSPRGAAALIRLCIQKLCKELGQPGKNINDDIGALVKAGLDFRVQRALDAVRVIGNNAVHPGSIDLTDDRSIAESLFKLLNLIAEKMISEPKHINEVYEALPAGVRAQIEARDKK